MSETGAFENSAAMTYAEEYEHGIFAVDAAFVRPRMASAYVVKCAEQAVIIETGTQHSVPHLLKILERESIAPEQVSYVMVTHVHLDHAGGAGGLLQVLPNAILLVHERGRRHLVDPAKLEASSRQVYGDDTFNRLYGRIIPAPAERVRAIKDGDTLEVSGRRFEFIDTPGHARHHYCVWDESSRGWFTGDTFGISYRELDTDNGCFIFPTTTPVQFDPQAMLVSVKRLLEKKPAWMYLTHFGRIGQVSKMGSDLLHGIEHLAAIAITVEKEEQRTTKLRNDIEHWLRSTLTTHGWQGTDEEFTYILGPDIELNAQGLEVWLQRQGS